MSDNQNRSGGLGLSTMVFIVFLTLKLCEIGVIADWSWWWVTSPLWIPLVIMVLIILMVWGLSLLVKLFDR